MLCHEFVTGFNPMLIHNKNRKYTIAREMRLSNGGGAVGDVDAAGDMRYALRPMVGKNKKDQRMRTWSFLMCF